MNARAVLPPLSGRLLRICQSNPWPLSVIVPMAGAMLTHAALIDTPACVILSLIKNIPMMIETAHVIMDQAGFF